MQKPVGNSCHAGQTEGGGGSRRGIAVSHKEKVGEKSAISKLKAIRAEEGGYFYTGKNGRGEKVAVDGRLCQWRGREKREGEERELGENEQLPLLLLIWGVGFSFSGKFALL